MAISRSHPMRFTPTGLVDASDATGKFPGACQALQNLIFDPSNPELAVSRPGVTTLVNFQGQAPWLSPGFISIHIGIGTRVYGMIATGRTPGFDEPFVFDVAANAFVPITGVTAANVPVSPSTSGDWTPPTMAAVGTMVVLTHPGFTKTNGYYGIIDVTNFAAPVWRSENTTTTPLTDVPTAVANFNNRAYFAVGNQTQFTDVLTNPLTITNATQALVIGDQAPIVALSGLPTQTTSSGVISALTVFKLTQTWQVTGDQTTANLALNYNDLNTGTNSPRSVAQSTYGMYFSSTGGPYFVDLLGQLRQVTHSAQESEADIRTPFQNARTPSRWAGGYNSSIYRVCGPTVIRGQGVTNDYWFDEHRRRWNGPHAFVYDCVSTQSGYFVLSGAGYPGILAKSEPVQTLSFVDSDLGTQYPTLLLSSTFPKTGDMAIKQVAESQIELGAQGEVILYIIRAEDEVGNELATATQGVSPNGLMVWNNFVWNQNVFWSGPLASNVWDGGGHWDDGSVWDSGTIAQIPLTYRVQWPEPLVFEKMQLRITTLGGNATIGTFYARYQQTGYMTIK